MIMNINVQSLKDAIDKAEAQHRAAHERAVAADDQYEADRLEIWMTEQFPRWIAASENIQHKIDNNQPILAEDLPRKKGGHSHEFAVFAPDAYRNPGDPRRVHNRTYRPDPELVYTRKALDLVAKGTIGITPAALANLGINTSKLRHVLSYLTEGDVA